MKRLLFIALALSINCRYLLLDEAFDGLDPLVLETVKEQIVRICKDGNKTVVVSSHNVTALEKLVDKFVIIHDGQLSNDGDIDSLGETFIKYQAIFLKPSLLETVAIDGNEIILLQMALANKEGKHHEKA